MTVKMISVPESFVQAVADMLEAQTAYFKGRKQSQLILAKNKETVVKSMLRSIRGQAETERKEKSQLEMWTQEGAA